MALASSAAGAAGRDRACRSGLDAGGGTASRRDPRPRSTNDQDGTTGRFLLPDILAGRQVFLIDGRSASRPGRTYGLFEVGHEIVGGATNALEYTTWMPRIDTAHAVQIPRYTTTEIMVTTPHIPGLELRIPAHSAILNHDGQIVTSVSITPIPVDRPPFPLPVNVEVPIYFTIQPGGAYVRSYERGARLIYPNYREAQPGAIARRSPASDMCVTVLSYAVFCPDTTAA